MDGAEKSEIVNVDPQHLVFRYEYAYDDRGNWTEQTQWTAAESDHKEFRSMVVKREFTYY